MNMSVKRLEETGSALRNALAQQDWAAIGVLDRQCRQAVDEAMSESERDEVQVRQGMLQLLNLYGELVSACQTERQRIAGELRQFNQARESAKVYQLFG